jgi:protein O-GlcNAc transferase
MDAAETARQLRKEGNGLLQLNMPLEALECFERALAFVPADASLLNDRGNALQSLQRFPEALASYDGALRSKREFAAAFTNRGNALRALRRFDEALADLDAAVRIKPDFPEALNNRGNVLRDLGRLPEALDNFTAALALRPDFALAECNRGHTLLDLRRPEESLVCFERVLQSVPDAGEALFGRASALLQLRQRLDQALVDFERAADRGIERTEGLVGKASVLAELQRHREAAACLSEALAITPDREYARGSLLYSKLQACDWTGLAAEVSELQSLLQRQQRVTHPLSLLPLIDAPDLQLTSAQTLVEDKYPQNNSLGPWLPRAATKVERRLRVAYVSADFREHPVSRLLVGVLEAHDRERFEILGISLAVGNGGAFEQRVRRAFDRVIDVTARNDREVAQLLREQEIDLAVDLMGFTQGLRPGIFAHRVAPVQVSYLGYAGTSGAPYIDYLLADEVVIPRGRESAYSEQIVRMPHCYLPYDNRLEIAAVPTRLEAGLPERGMVFCAFTAPYKINPEVFGIWMRLLRAVPESVLWLREMAAETRENLEQEAQARGVDPKRLIFAAHVASMEEHLGRHALADLYLDTLPYNAHSTACDALWAGLPVLTWAGNSFASRVAASALMAVGLPELIAHDLADYERLALELAQQPHQLRELREKLARQRLQAPLFDTQRFCRHLEEAYRGMHQRAVSGKAPAGFDVVTRLTAVLIQN